MAIDGNRSTFPTTIDNFQEYIDLSPSEVTNAARWQVLKLKVDKTSLEISEFNTLTTALASKIFTPEALNKMSDIMYQLENFFKNNVEGYITTKQAEFDATITVKSSQFDTTLAQFSDKGVWSNVVTYASWNTIEYDNELYISKQNDNVNHIPVGDGIDLWWRKIAKRGIQGVAGLGLSWLGEYNNTYSYTIGNAVRYNNNIYYCINASTSNLPTDVAYWQIFLSSTGIAIQASAPTVPFLGMVWIDSSTSYNIMKYWDGSVWQVIGTDANKVTLADSGNIIDSLNVEDALQEIVTNLNTHLNKTSRVSNTLLTVTSATSVLSYTPTIQGNFNIGIYFRVITGTTNVTVVVTYTDDTGAQTNTLLSAQSCVIGSYSTLPLFINAKTTGAITIAVTASIANRVYVSASIEGV